MQTGAETGTCGHKPRRAGPVRSRRSWGRVLPSNPQRERGPRAHLHFRPLSSGCVGIHAVALSPSGLWKFVVNPGRVTTVCSLVDPSSPFPERRCPRLHLEMRKRSHRQGDPSPGPQELTGGRGQIATQGF